MEKVFGLSTTSFDTNGGSLVESQQLLRGETVERPNDPVRTNYIFLGWFEDNNIFEKLWDFSVAPNKDITLFAKWELFGITLEPSGDIDFGSETAGYGAITALLVTVTNTGNMPTGDLRLSLSGANGFNLSTNEIENMEPRTNAYFTIGPKDSLPVGSYSAVLTITNGGIITFNINLSFTVTKIIGVVTWPAVNPGTITYGTPLSGIGLTGGSTELGSFAWQEASIIPAVVNSGYIAVFTPFDTENYEWPELTRNFAVTVNPRSITVTPDATQNKVYGTNDPVLTYTSSEQLITGNAFTGTLSRTPGEDAGLYNIALGSLGAGANYSLALGGNVQFEITKAPGAAVSGFTVSGNPGTYEITVSDVVLANTTGQGFEYSFSTTNSPSVWTAISSYFGSIDTLYYIFVRTIESANYTTGAASEDKEMAFYTVTFDSAGGSPNPANLVVVLNTAISAPQTPVLTGFNFNGWFTQQNGQGTQWNFSSPLTSPLNLFAYWIEHDTRAVLTLDIQEIVDDAAIIELNYVTQISRSAANGPVTYDVTVTNLGAYSANDIRWEVRGVGVYAGQSVTETGLSFTLDAGNVIYNSPGGHILIMDILVGGTVMYRRNILFTIAE